MSSYAWLIQYSKIKDIESSKRMILLSVSAVHQPFLYFDFYLYSVFAAHYIDI